MMEDKSLSCINYRRYELWLPKHPAKSAHKIEPRLFFRCRSCFCAQSFNAHTKQIVLQILKFLENNDRRVSIEASDAENKHWATIREKRKKICLEGLSFVWARSPTKDDLEKIYKEHESVEKSLKSERRRMEKEERKRRKSHKKAEAKTRRLEKLNLKAESSSSDLTSDSDSDSDHEQKKKKKSSKKSSKKDKKSKKKRDKKSKKKKRKHESSEDSGDEIHSTKKIKKRKETKSTSEDEWVEVTKTMHAEDEQRVREENSHIIGPAIPEYIIQKDELPKSSIVCNNCFWNFMLICAQNCFFYKK